MILLMMLAGCGSTYTLEGQLEDGVFGGPIGGFDLIATADAPEGLALNCNKLAGKANDDGTFRIEGLCGGTSYTVASPNNFMVPDITTVPDGGFGGPKAGKAYRAPGGDGFYLLTKGDPELKPTRSNVGYRTDKLPDGSPVRYPTQALKNPPVLSGDMILLATGEMTEVPFRAMVAHPEGLELIDGRLPPARTLGEPVEQDAGSVRAVVVGDQKLHLYSAGIVPEGRYALLAENAQRMLILDVGKQQPGRVGKPKEEAE